MKQETMLAQDLIEPLQEIFSTDYSQEDNEDNILNLLPAAVYVCDMTGVIKKYNDQAVKLWGTRPISGDNDELFFKAFKFYKTDGTYLPYNQTPAAACLKHGLPQRDIEMIIERADLSRSVVRGNVVAIKDAKGRQRGIINYFYDITEQKKTEKELEWKKKELQDYIDNAAIGLHWVDGNGIIKWANKAELDMLGYTNEEYIGHHISEFHVQQEKITDILKRLSLNETLDQYESALRCKDGSTRTVHISSNVFWEEEKFIHTRCFTVDVTAQKKLFDQLHTSEERHRQLLKNLPIAIYTCDADGRIAIYNDAAVKLWGREPELGKDLWCGSWKITNMDGSPLPLDSCPMAICLKEGRAVYGKEIIVIRPDGDLRYVLPHPQPVYDASGKLSGAVNMLMDITELKKIEKALRDNEEELLQFSSSLEKKVKEKTFDLTKRNEDLKKSEERYHKMVEEVEDYAIILLDKDGIIQNWNKGAEKIKGYKEEEIVGKNFRLFYLAEDREKELPTKLLNQAVQKGKAIHEGWRLRKDGTAFWGSIVLTALHNKQNEIIGFSKVTRDLTERKLAEEKMKEYTSQLEFQNDQLEQFAYAASHDMKEPLRKIIFYNNHLSETIAANLQDKEKDYLNRSINAAKRMQKLVEDLLEYSKISSDKQNFEQVDLNEIVDEVFLSYKEITEDKKAIIQVASLPFIYGIAFQLRQLFDNLISNAFKYSHSQRNPVIKISAEKITGTGSDDLEKEKDYYKISVADNGIGFEPEYSEKIFELFQRLQSKTQYSGSGVGLALCKKIIQNHHGYIKAGSKENEGATFDLYIPA